MTISILLSLIVLGSAVAFNDVVSLAINGLYTSYLIGNTLLLWRRITGQITPYAPHSATLTNTVGAGNLSWGPWCIPEPLGTISNALGCSYMLTVLFFSFWPVAANPNAASMNYSCVMVGAVIIFSMLYYILWARRFYKGPVVEVEL
jgi:choline transport protein